MACAKGGSAMDGVTIEHSAAWVRRSEWAARVVAKANQTHQWASLAEMEQNVNWCSAQNGAVQHHEKLIGP